MRRPRRYLLDPFRTGEDVRSGPLPRTQRSHLSCLPQGSVEVFPGVSASHGNHRGLQVQGLLGQHLQAAAAGGEADDSEPIAVAGDDVNGLRAD